MAYQLRDDVHFCWIGPVPFFLDLSADRYFRLAGQTILDFRAVVDNKPITRQAAEQLIEAGAISASKSSAAAIEETPRRNYVEAVCDQPVARAPSTILQLRAFSDLLHASFALRYRGLARVLKMVVAKKKRAVIRNDTPATAQIAAAYRRVDLLFSSENGCLRRSVAMALTMMRFGREFDLVIGVRSGPFGAHCWLMQGDLVLNDRLDKVREFTPILVL